MVNSFACPKTLLYIPLRALTAFGKTLFFSAKCSGDIENGKNRKRKKKQTKTKRLKIDKILLCKDLSSLRINGPLYPVSATSNLHGFFVPSH